MKSTPLYPYTYEAELEREEFTLNPPKSYAEYVKFELENSKQ